jgi:hypothetical protein
MRDLRDISTHEMVHAFLKAEIDTEKWRVQYANAMSALQVDRAALVDNPDLADSSANYLRAALLGKVRGYGCDAYLFKGFPLDTTWRQVLIEVNDFGRLFYLNQSSFVDGAGGTRSIIDSVGVAPRDNAFAEKVEGIVHAIQQDATLDPVILVVGRNDTLIVLEGNHRTRAFVEFGKKPFEAYVGRSPSMGEWTFI